MPAIKEAWDPLKRAGTRQAPIISNVDGFKRLMAPRRATRPFLAQLRTRCTEADVRAADQSKAME